MKPISNARSDNRLLMGLIACLFLSATPARVSARPATTTAQAIATVRSLLNKNAGPCRIDKIRAVSAGRSRDGWVVTTQIVISTSGRPLNETVKWTVSFSDGVATPNSQLAFEIGHGCR